MVSDKVDGAPHRVTECSPAAPKHIHQDHVYCCVDLNHTYFTDKVVITLDFLTLSLMLL
jgi:hypothetical protein